jgi:uncharacterized glyoxalase superfamily protein PhnB
MGMVFNIQTIHTILYVENQGKSAEFYRHLLQKEPSLNVPGMTEFKMSDNFTLGIMPSQGIVDILHQNIPHPDTGKGIPRCELYFYVDDLSKIFNHALSCGATLISGIEERNWGDNVCYFSDYDGHIIAFATKNDIK